MGKSAGKWIKTVLFRKKYSKSSLSKDATLDKKATAKTPVEDLAGNSPIISDPFQLNRGSENMEIEKGTSGIPCDTVAFVPVNQGVDSQNDFVSAPVNDAEMRRQVQAATKTQAAFRGYLARRAFRALKGIIRLQALIRGHLVRRQAAATLRCMHAIVKVQSLVRGRSVRLLDARFKVAKKSNKRELQDCKKVDIGANSYFGSEKLATNAFVCKILTSLPIAIPLSLEYDLNEPNSAWNWLERWSFSHFWQPPARTKKVLNGKFQRKQIGSQTVVTEGGKSKRSVRKISTEANGDNCALASFETDKPKRNPRKVPNHQTEVVQEHPQNELEKVKRNLRKVSSPVVADSEKFEMETEKPQPHQSVKTVSNVATSEKEMGVSPENVTDLVVVVDKLALLEPPSKTKMMDEPIDEIHDHHPVAEMCPLENGEKIDHSPILHEELNSKEDQNGKENQKMRKRRSLPAKQEYPENISQNNPTLPSYMAATESAKAKLRAQGSSKFDEDDVDYGFVRRHSLPASTNGKLSTLSPRIQKPVQANGKAGSKTSRLLTASRDDKVVQPGWRR